MEGVIPSIHGLNRDLSPGFGTGTGTHIRHFRSPESAPGGYAMDKFVSLNLPLFTRGCID